VGDVRILPQPVFGCPTAAFHAADPLPYVYHMFMGSWKMSQSNGLKTFIRKLSNTLHRQQQLKEHNPTSGATAAAGAVTTGSNSSSHVNKHPRRPILEEQIRHHMSQQQQQQQQVKRKQELVHSQQPGRHHQQQQERAAAAGAQPLRLPARQQQEAHAGAAAAQSQLSARKLRSSHALLVRGPAVPHTLQHLISEPEVPSRALSGMPALSLLLVALLLVTLYKQQHSSMYTRLRAYLQDCLRAAGSAVGIHSRSPLSRPHSRTHLSPVVGSPLLVTSALPPAAPVAVAAGAAAIAGKSSLPVELEAAVCYSSSQQAGRAHRHKRSWGSSSSFQQL